MKWAIFAIALMAMPPLIVWLRGHPQQHLKVWTFIGIFPFVAPILPKTTIALIGAPTYPGFVSGVEISLVDLVLLCIYLSFPAPATSGAEKALILTFASPRT